MSPRGPLSLAALTTLVALVGCSHRSAPRARPRPESPPDVEAVVGRHRVVWDPAARTEAITAGRELFARLDCVRCHAIDDTPPASRPEQCTSCHHFLVTLPTTDRRYREIASHYGEAVLARYQRTIRHYVEVPDLTRIGERLDPAWLAEWVGSPHDLRPMLDEAMVRVVTAPKDRVVIARYFAAVAGMPDPARSAPPVDLGPPPTPSAIDRGARRFRELGCNGCHVLGNVRTGRTEAELRAKGDAAALAPNLRFARERMHRDVLVAFVRAPRAFVPEGHMPDLHVSAADAEALADFILFVDPQLLPTPPATEPELPPAVDRPVGWAEVKERVLGHVCVHCHMNDHERDPGPGNVGGFGFPGEHLRMRTYEMLVAGAGHGEYAFSVLVPRAGQTIPPILLGMLQRRREQRIDRIPPFGDYRPERFEDGEPGMPMGLPAMNDEEMGILRAWIEQGCPGPTEVTGMPGITDGSLVPDGPIAANRGCERRDPAAMRPAWSTQPPPAWAH